MKYEVYKVRNLTEEELKKENEKKEKAVKKNKEYYVKKKIRNKIQNISVFEWRDNKKDQFLSFNFTTDQKLAIGNEIELYSYTDRKTVFFGKIEKEDPDKNGIKYSGYDYGYLLLNEPVTIQYNGTSVKNSISEVLAKKELKFENLNIETTPNIQKIYRNETIHDVLDDIYKISLEQNILSDNYYFNCKNGALNLSEYTEVDRIQGYTGGRYRINSFEYVISVDGRTWNRKQQIEFQDGSTLKVYADYKLQTGIYTHIRNDVLKMNDYYLVTSSKHYIKGGLEEVEVTLVKYKPINNESSSNESTPSL